MEEWTNETPTEPGYYWFRGSVGVNSDTFSYIIVRLFVMESWQLGAEIYGYGLMYASALKGWWAGPLNFPKPLPEAMMQAIHDQSMPDQGGEDGTN